MKNVKHVKKYHLDLYLIFFIISLNYVGRSVIASESNSKNPASSTQSIVISEQWQNASSWNWQAKVQKPKFHYTENNEIILQVESLENDSRLGYPSLPHFTKIFNTVPEDISYHVNGKQLQVEPLPGIIRRFNDIPKSGGTESLITDTEIIQLNNLYPKEIVDISFLGYFNDIPLTRLTIYPYQLIDNGKQIRFHQDLNVSVSISENSTFINKSPEDETLVLDAIGIPSKSVKVKPQPTLSKLSNHYLYGKDFVRIVLDQDGIYRISRSTLIDSGATIQRIDPRTFQMFNRGKEVAIYVNGESDGKFDKSDYIEFFGKRNQNSVAEYEFDPFTDKNVFFLTWGNQYGLRYAEESAKTTIPSSKAIVPSDYTCTQHVEQNAYFERFGQVDIDLPTYTRDHWFFDSGISGGTTKSYPFQLIYPNSNSVNQIEINVGMHGLTYQSGSHSVEVFINDYFAADGSWADQKPYQITNDESQVLLNRFLKHEDNTIRLSVAGNDPTNKYDKVLFDYLEIGYDRLYKAFNGTIDFCSPQNTPTGIYHFNIDGFEESDISVYKIGMSKLMDFSVKYNTMTKDYSILIEDQIHDWNTQYFAASVDGMLSPISIHTDTIFNISNESFPVDLLIITCQNFSGHLANLLSFYQDIGVQAQVVDIQDIYNEFNDGIISPYAIKKYLTHVRQNWVNKPRYILLIGDSGIKEEKSVPAFFYQSYKYGACPSDHWYVVTDEYSGIPEFSIGRWPVKTIEELDIAVNKRINYSENTPIDLWRNELLFIAGYEDAFKNQSENMINRQVPKEFSINRIYINPSSRSSAFFGGSDTLIYLLNNGLTLVNFMGHGGGGVWSDRSLFNTSHIEFLNNYDKLPFITSLTCFTADFASMTGLGEHMLLAENGGSIGLWGATSVGWIKNDYLLAKPFYDAIFTSGITVGEAIQAAKISYLADNYFDYLKQSMVNSFNLIGDPTLQLPFPDKQARLDIDDENPESGQTIELSGNLPFSSGEIYTQLYDSSTYRVFSEPLQQSFNNATIQQSITLPTEINPGSTFINYYFTNADQSLDGHGVTLLSIRGVNFYNLETFPNSIEKNTPFDISIQTELADFDSIICELDTLNAYEYLDENGIEFISSFQNPDNIFSKKMIRDSQVSQKWQTVSPITIGTSGKLIGVRFRVFDTAQNTTVSPNFSVKIKRAPDLSIQKIYQGGTHFPELIIDVNYSGDDTITTTLTAYRINGATESIFGTEHFQLYPNLNTSISVPGILGADLQKFKVVLDEQNFIDESNESNNVLIDSILISTYPLLPTIGTSIDGTSYDTISVGNYSIYLGPNSIIDSSAIHFAIDTVESISDQPQFSLISLDNSDQFQCLNITIPCLHDTLLQPLTIKMTGIDSIDQSLSFGRWDSFLKLWIKENTTFTDSTISAESIKPGKFSLIKCSDVEPPQLELSLDGQQFFQNSYVSNKPNISIIGEDQNGVLLDNRGLIILLDGNPVNFSELNIPDTLATGRFISAQFRPELEFGDHDLEVKLKDAAGNLSTDQIYFTVSNEIKLIDYGNYPNPFKDRTVFIYELTQRVENFKIKIYTTSGRLIKILEESTIYSTGLDIAEGGYHEILWDGRDENENFIANGVYFYKMIAQGKNKTVSSIGKIAKAR